MSDVDWNRYRKCPVCYAKIGDACTVMTGQRAVRGNVTVFADAPHATRQLRVGAR